MIVINQLYGSIGFLYSIVGSIGLLVVVVQLPIDTWSSTIEHPLDYTCGMGPSDTEGFEHCLSALIVEHIRPSKILVNIGCVTKTVVNYLIKLAKGVHCRTRGCT